MLSIFGVTIVLYFIKILSGSKNFWMRCFHLARYVLFAETQAFWNGLSFFQEMGKFTFLFLYVFAESNGLSNGTIAGVVVAVLLVILLVVGIGIYWRQKRKRDLYGPKQFNNPILYTTANSDEFELELK